VDGTIEPWCYDAHITKSIRICDSGKCLCIMLLLCGHFHVVFVVGGLSLTTHFSTNTRQPDVKEHIASEAHVAPSCTQ
jgi:hypothetical protein